MRFRHELIQERCLTPRFIIPPTAVQELAYLADYGDSNELRELAHDAPNRAESIRRMTPRMRSEAGRIKRPDELTPIRQGRINTRVYPDCAWLNRLT